MANEATAPNGAVVLFDPSCTAGTLSIAALSRVGQAISGLCNFEIGGCAYGSAATFTSRRKRYDVRTSARGRLRRISSCYKNRLTRLKSQAVIAQICFRSAG